jgi:hypothetical protein
VNILLDYLYRDGGNNKSRGHVLFSNLSNMSLEHITELIEANLIDGCFFVAEKVGIPTLYLHPYDADLEHGWHEFSSIEEAPLDSAFSGQDIRDFLVKLESK